MSTLSRKEFKEQMNSLREEMHSMGETFNEKLSGYVTFSEKLEQARERAREREREDFNRWCAERDKRLEELARRSEAHTEKVEKIAQQMMQKTTDGNRHYWLSTLTGVVATVLSVAALVVGAVYATRPSNSNSAQMALTAFQQGQRAASVNSVPPK